MEEYKSSAEPHYFIIFAKVEYHRSMSSSKKRKKVVKTSKAKRKKSSSESKSSSEGAEFQLLFNKKNYTFVLIGLGFIFLGMLLMMGGGQESPESWDADKIYSFTRITLAPFLILVGLALQIVAIFKK